MSEGETRKAEPTDFIREMIRADVAAGKHGGQVVTRFPPEPNGYLHIGHAKAICIDFGVAKEFGGRCHLRMDDTNPTTEDMEYVEAIKRDVRWLGFDWGEHLYFASDYFDRFYELGEKLIRLGRAYVCDLPEETFSKEYRGTITEHGKESPFRKRSVEENLDLFRRMKAGEFKDGERVLRAKIDMTSPNMKLRDPPLVRIKHAHHYRTGDKWCIYPLYDFAHCLSDYLEGITHSICTLEFEVHRPLYDWILESLDLPRVLPRQYEFAKLIPNYTIVSKRKLLQLVSQGAVSGWDDPRLPTLSGLRRRGIPAAALRRFVIGLGVTKYESVTDIAVLEHAVRDHLNDIAPRRFAVLEPIKVVLTNIPEGERYSCAAPNHPKNETLGSRTLEFGRELYIDADDFAEVPPPKFFRLKPGGEVRLKYALVIRCDEVVKDADGRLVELRCTADLNTRTGQPDADRKVKGTIHWVDAQTACSAEVRLYDRLFNVPEPDADGDFMKHLNPASLKVLTAKLEPALASARLEDRFQFERLGYFALDPVDSTAGKPVFNRTITLKDTWAK